MHSLVSTSHHILSILWGPILGVWSGEIHSQLAIFVHLPLFFPRSIISGLDYSLGGTGLVRQANGGSIIFVDVLLLTILLGFDDFS
jgi:hypothetical protein